MVGPLETALKRRSKLCGCLLVWNSLISPNSNRTLQSRQCRDKCFCFHFEVHFQFRIFSHCSIFLCFVPEHSRGKGSVGAAQAPGVFFHLFSLWDRSAELFYSQGRENVRQVRRNTRYFTVVQKARDFWRIFGAVFQSLQPKLQFSSAIAQNDQRNEGIKLMVGAQNLDTILRFRIFFPIFPVTHKEFQPKSAISI